MGSFSGQSCHFWSAGVCGSVISLGSTTPTTLHFKVLAIKSFLRPQPGRGNRGNRPKVGTQPCALDFCFTILGSEVCCWEPRRFWTRRWLQTGNFFGRDYLTVRPNRNLFTCVLHGLRSDDDDSEFCWLLALVFLST